MQFKLGQKVRQIEGMYNSLKGLIGTILTLPTLENNYYGVEFYVSWDNKPQTWYFEERDLITDSKFKYFYSI